MKTAAFFDLWNGFHGDPLVGEGAEGDEADWHGPIGHIIVVFDIFIAH